MSRTDRESRRRLLLLVFAFLPLIGGANSFFGITPEAFGAIGALVNFAVAFAVDKVTKEPPEHIQHMVEAVRIPRGSKAVDGAH